MKRTLARIVLGIVGMLLLVFSGMVAFVELRWDARYDAPLPDIHASRDSAVIAQGRYLVLGPAHCSYCHTTPGNWQAIDAGKEVPLSGGNSFKLPLGTIYTPNLTPDVETGIGRYTDGQLARMIRHGVTPDGRAAVPFMAFQNLSDEDVTAVISYLRAQPAVRNDVPEHDLNVLGRAVMAFLIRPIGPEGTPPAASPAAGPTVERGKYLANSVGECSMCHTRRSPVDGSAVGPLFSGGAEMAFDDDPSRVFVTPNLTPDPKTGHITSWTEEQFLARFRAGRLIEGSHMPWPLFGRMSDDDIRAVYRYLRTLEPVENETGPLVQEKS